MPHKHRFTAPGQELQTQAAEANQRAVMDGPSRRGPTEDEIRARAYEVYRSRGDAPGSAAQDWAQAERDLRRGRK